jgi:WD40 repeat protein
MIQTSRPAVFLTTVVVIVFSALAAAVLIQSRRAASLERRLGATMARAAQREDQLQAVSVKRHAELGLVLEAPAAAHHPLGSMDSICRLTTAWLKTEIPAASVAPDGARVAAIVDDEVRVWNAATGGLAQQIRFENESPFSVTFSPDQRTLAVGVAVPHSRRSGVRIIRYADEDRQAEFWGERFEGRYLAFSHDGRALAYSRLGGVTLWNTITGRPELTIEHRDSAIDSLALSPRGDRLAFGVGSGDLVLWELATTKKIGLIHGHRRAIVSIDFSPDGSSVASGSLDHFVKVWDAATGSERASLHHESSVGCIDRVLAVRFSPDGATLISAHTDKRARFWDMASFRLAGVSTLSECTDSNESEILSVSLAHDGRSLVGIMTRFPGAEIRNEASRIAIWDVLAMRSTLR